MVIALSHLREESNFELMRRFPEIEVFVDPYIQYGNHHTWIKEDEFAVLRGDTLTLRSDGQGARLGVVDMEILVPRATFLPADRLKELQAAVGSGHAKPEEKTELDGFKGKNLFTLRRVSLEPHYGSDPEMEQLIEKWKANVDPAQVPRIADPLPRKSEFLTVENCKGCHQKQYDNWLKTRHAEALATLVASGDDTAFDCVGCHTLGYGLAYVSFSDIGSYANVQCESCHGTNPSHAKDPKKFIFGKVERETCINCHNKEVLDKPFEAESRKREVQCPRG
jgi:hypothetical protein